MSLIIDTIINILDDILDENMETEEKAMYIVEFIRIFSLYNNIHFKKIYNNTIVRERTDEYAEDLYNETYALVNDIKAFLELRRA